MTRTILILLSLFLVSECRGQATYVGLLQTNRVNNGTRQWDTVTASNNVAAQNTMVWFVTYEATCGTAHLSSITNSSNYSTVIVDVTCADSVHNQAMLITYCTNGFTTGGIFGFGYSQSQNLGTVAYVAVNVSGASSTGQPASVYTNSSPLNNTAMSITNNAAGSVVLGMLTSDGQPLVTSGAYQNVSNYFTGINPVEPLDTNINFVSNSTSGLCSAYFYTNVASIATNSFTNFWMTNGPAGAFAKSTIFMVMALSPAPFAYYVDCTNGLDSNTGTMASPFQHCPGDTNYTGSVTPSPGNTFIFRGGYTYTGSGNGGIIVVKQSGSPGSPITYDGNTAGTFGTGMAIIDCQSNNSQAFVAYHGTPENNIVIQGFQVVHLLNMNYYQNQWVNTFPYTQDNAVTTNLVNYSGRNDVYGDGGVFVTGTNWTINGCQFSATQNWGYRTPSWNNTNSTTNYIQCQQCAVHIYDATNVTITNCAAWDIGRSCVLSTATSYANSNIVITGCNWGGYTNGTYSVTLTNRGWFATTWEGSANGLIISNTVAHDGWQREGDDAYQRDHAGDWFHIFGANAGTYSALDATNILMANIACWNDTNFTTSAGTADVFPEQGVWGLTIQNCLFKNPHHFAVRAENAIIQGLYLYNDTMISYTNAASPLDIENVQNCTYSNLVSITFSSNSAIMPLVILPNAAQSNIVGDYNDLYNPYTLNYGSVRAQNTDSNLVAWAGASGNDAHSITNNPNLVTSGVLNSGATSGEDNSAPAVGSPLLSAGANLTAAFTGDLLFAARPSSGAWTIGPIQNSQGGSSLGYIFLRKK